MRSEMQKKLGRDMIKSGQIEKGFIFNSHIKIETINI
jgi:hypothetical protein